MITFLKLCNMGKFGNILFQYATLKSVGIQKKYKVKIEEKKKKYLNLYMNIDVDVLKKDDLKNIKNYYIEKNGNSSFFDLSIFDIKDNTCLEGYFQSEKYFIDIEEQIRKEYSFRDDLVKVIENIKFKMKEKFGNEKFCSVHFRRGDYLNSVDNTFVKGKKYFLNAKELLYSKIKSEKLIFLIFSDDIEWCKENIIPKKYENFIYIDFFNYFIHDFVMMSRSNYHIISNSSFSWWSAWLGNDEEKIVISPNNWFGKMNNEEQTKDIYPKKWLIVESC